MALLFMDGFDFVSPTANAAATAAALLPSWVASGYISANTASPRFNRGSAIIKYFGGTGSIVRYLGETVPTLHLGFAFRPDAIKAGVTTQRFLSFMVGSSDKCFLNYTNLDKIDVYTGGTLRATSAVAGPGFGVWRFVEVSYAPSSTSVGRVVIKVDGVAVLDYMGISSADSSPIDTIAFKDDNSINGNQSAFQIDDVYAISGSGDAPTGHIGPVVVEGLTVSGAGSLSQWTPSSGANYTCVDEDYGHNGDTDYVSSGTPGVADTYAMDDVSSSAAAIVAVQVTSIARKDDAGAHAIRNRVRLGGVNYDSAPMSVFDSYTAVMSSWLLNPATGATWSAAALNDAEVGFKLES